MRRLLLLLTVFAGLTTACTEVRPQAEGAGGVAIGGEAPEQVDRPGPRAVAVDGHRAAGNVVAAAGENAAYNYAPSVMVEGSTVRMWWCSQLASAAPPGDDVLYAEAATVAGPFAGGRAVFGGGGAGFDGRHTCDPSVIKAGGTYFLYYTGAPSDHGVSNAIGLAYSTDGVNWVRANGGHPIVTSSNEVARANSYGAGQPSAIYLDGWFYLMFTDTNGRGAVDNGAGQFVLRSKDPAFTSGVESLGEHGFSAGNGRSRSVVEAFSADWMWIDAMNAFAIGHETGEGTTITFWDKDFTSNPYQPVLVAGPWEEGPGLLRRPDGHAPIDAVDPCGRVHVDLIRATRNKTEPTDLKHFGVDLKDVGGCADSASALVTLDGFAVLAPRRTLDLVVGGEVIRVDRRSVAEAAGARILLQRAPALDKAKIAAHLTAGAHVVRAEGKGMAFLLAPDRLYPIGSATVATANSSQVTDVAPATWDRYSVGPAFAGSR